MASSPATFGFDVWVSTRPSASVRRSEDECLSKRNTVSVLAWRQREHLEDWAFQVRAFTTRERDSGIRGRAIHRQDEAEQCLLAAVSPCLELLRDIDEGREAIHRSSGENGV